MNLPKIDLTKLLAGLHEVSAGVFEHRWFKSTNNGELLTETSSRSANSYGPHVQMLGDGVAGILQVNIDEIIYTSPDVTYVNNIFVRCTAGVLYIEVTRDDGASWETILFTSVVTSTGVETAKDNELASGEHTILTKDVLGTITNYRLKQKGAVASNGFSRYGVS